MSRPRIRSHTSTVPDGRRREASEYAKDAAPLAADALRDDAPVRDAMLDRDGLSADNWLWSRSQAQIVDHGGEFVRRHLPTLNAGDVIESLTSQHGHARDWNRAASRALGELYKTKPEAPAILDEGQDWREVSVSRWQGLGLDKRARR